MGMGSSGTSLGSFHWLQCKPGDPARHGLTSVCLLIAWTRLRGLVLCWACQWFFTHLKVACPEPGAIRPWIYHWLDNLSGTNARGPSKKKKKQVEKDWHTIPSNQSSTNCGLWAIYGLHCFLNSLPIFPMKITFMKILFVSFCSHLFIYTHSLSLSLSFILKKVSGEDGVKGE